MNSLSKTLNLRCFVAGATGLTGRHVIRHLVSAGVEATAHIRPDSSRLPEWSARFQGMGAMVSQTPWRIDDMAATLRELRPNIIFALLGTTKKRARSGDGDYEAVDYGLTALLIEAVKQSDIKPVFVYLSSAGVSPDSTSAYMSVRARVEALLSTSGIKTVVARPSFILGDRDEPRPGERIGAGLIDGCLSVVSLFGGGQFSSK